MRVFDFSWQDHREAYEREGWVHIRRGVTPEFLDAVRDVIQRAAEDTPLTGTGISGQKDQFLFDIPASVDCDRELFDVLAPLTGLERAAMTLSERHIKAYSADADPWPTAHKDRLSSRIAVGVAVRVPPRSRLVLYPYDHREVNPFYVWPRLRDSLEPSRLPEVVLPDAREVEVYEEPGDVVIFAASSTWHLRRHSAGTVSLYLKFNDFDSDPLGEDPRTEERRAATLRALQGDRDMLATTLPVLGRRFDSVVREHSRDGWRETLWAILWGQPPLPLSEGEFAVLRSMARDQSFASVTASGRHGLSPVEAEEAIRRLAAGGAVDLVDGPPVFPATLIDATVREEAMV